MNAILTVAGQASPELFRKAHRWWRDAAARSNVKLEGFDPENPLVERVSWALASGLDIATVYSRFSSKLQHSTDDQVRECVEWAAHHRMYAPPELISVDEATTGKQIRRDGLNRMKQILKQRIATVLLVYKVSRLFRQAFSGYELIQQEVVEENLRAVSVSQGIDTNDKKGWKIQLQTHGLVDDLLLDAIADHVRTGLKGLFLQRWTTGALGVGYRRKELPEAPRTKRGLVRTVPEVDPRHAELIRRHAQLHLDGMSLTEGRRRWIEAGGPCDPRSTTGQMSAAAYRRLWSNVRLTGRWEFGRKRNQFSTRRDYSRQIEQPDSEVVTLQCEELRILDDETFLKLQIWLQGLKQGPRGPRTKKPIQLWDLTTEFFFCSACSQADAPVRFYQTGAHGLGMQCKRGSLCPCHSAVRRRNAVVAICEKLAELIERDTDLINSVIAKSLELQVRSDDDKKREIESLEQRIRRQTRRIDDLLEMAGEGSDRDRREVRAKIKSAQAERSGLELDLTRLRKALQGDSGAISGEDICATLADVTSLLKNAAAGALGEEAVHKALGVFRRLTGGNIKVHVEPRPGRKQKNVRGVFKPRLVQAVRAQVGLSDKEDLDASEVVVWLREPPLQDRLAPRVHQLIDVEGHSYRSAAKALQAEGHKINSGGVWQCYHRHYEMIGAPAPKRPYNNGHRRQAW